MIAEMTYFVGRGERDVDDVLADIDSSSPARTRLPPSRPSAAVRRRPAHQAAAVRLHRRVDEPGRAPMGGDRPARALHRGSAPASGARRQPARPDDLVAGLREAFDRLDDGRARRRVPRWRASMPFGRSPSATSPCTRSRAPKRSGTSLAAALTRPERSGIDEYERVRDDLVQRVIEAKLRKLAALDPATCTVAAWNSATTPRPAVVPRHDEPHRPTRRRGLPRAQAGRPAPERRRRCQTAATPTVRSPERRGVAPRRRAT